MMEKSTKDHIESTKSKKSTTLKETEKKSNDVKQTSTKSISKEKNKNEKKKFNFFAFLLKIILILICLCLIFGTIAILFYNSFILDGKSKIVYTNNQAIILQDETFEYGTKLSYDDILSKVVNVSNLYENTQTFIFLNDELLPLNGEYTFDKTGSVKITLKTFTQILSFLPTKAEVIKDATWKIQDTEKPVISGVKNQTITEGEKFNPKAGITAKDNVDGKLEVTISGKYDVNKPGKYNLTAKAVDKSNNETTKKFVLTVEEKIIEEEPEDDYSSSSGYDEGYSSSNNSSSSSSSSSSGSSNSSSGSNSSSNSNSSSGSSSSSNSDDSSSSSSSSPTYDERLSLARAEARRVVNNIISSGMSNYEKAEAICMYITNTVDVQTDQSSEAYETNYGNEAYAALIMKIAACSGRCRAVTLLCDAAGLNSQHINAGEWTHQWNKVQMEDGSWIVIDSQIGFIGDTHPLE